MRKKIKAIFLTLLCCISMAGIVFLSSCSSDDGDVASSYAVYLEETCAVPDPSSVAFQVVSSGGESAAAEVVVTDVADVYAASLHIYYDPDLVYMSCTEGNFLNSDGNDTEFIVDSDTAGLLIIGISRKNVSYGVDAVGSKTLLRLTITAKSNTGSSTVCFSNGYLLDSSEPPQEIPDVSWCCGLLTVERI